MPNTYVIADLHGRYDLLIKAMTAADEHSYPEPFTFIILGDMVDRGPYSKQILDWCQVWQYNHEKGYNRGHLIVLKGNHENIMHEVMTTTTEDGRWVNQLLSWWLGNGGGATLKSYGYKSGDERLPLPDRMARDLAYIKQLPVYHMDQYRAYVHAGFAENRSLEEQKEEYMTWRYEKDWKDIDYSFEGRFVVHGHIQDAENPHQTANKINLDTFAWNTGRLAIAVFDDDVPGGPTDILWAIDASHESIMAGYPTAVAKGD